MKKCIIILNKKRIILICSCVIVSLCVWSLYLHKRNVETPEAVGYDIVTTVALPVSNKIIVIDAGHGNPDGRSCRK